MLLVAFLFLVNIAQIADEILVMVCLLSRHQYLRNQVALLTIEYMIETCGWLNRSSIVRGDVPGPLQNSVVQKDSLPLGLNSNHKDSFVLCENFKI